MCLVLHALDGRLRSLTFEPANGAVGQGSQPPYQQCQRSQGQNAEPLHECLGASEKGIVLGTIGLVLLDCLLAQVVWPYCRSSISGCRWDTSYQGSKGQSYTYPPTIPQHMVTSNSHGKQSLGRRHTTCAKAQTYWGTIYCAMPPLILGFLWPLSTICAVRTPRATFTAGYPKWVGFYKIPLRRANT